MVMCKGVIVEFGWWVVFRFCFFGKCRYKIDGDCCVWKFFI